MPDFDPKDVEPFNLYDFVNLRYVYLQTLMYAHFAKKLRHLTDFDQVIRKKDFDAILLATRNEHNDRKMDLISLIGYEDVDHEEYKNIEFTRPNYAKQENHQHYAWSNVRNILFENVLEAYCFDEYNGSWNLIPRWFWGSSSALSVLSTSMISDEFVLEFKGCVVVEKSKVVSLMDAEVDELISEYVKKDEIIKSNSSVDEFNGTYISPYIEFMINASKNLNLSEGNMIDGSRMPLEHIKYWLKSNWNEELGECSDHKINIMSTLIRHPKDGRGGRSVFFGDDYRRLRNRDER